MPTTDEEHDDAAAALDNILLDPDDSPETPEPPDPDAGDDDADLAADAPEDGTDDAPVENDPDPLARIAELVGEDDDADISVLKDLTAKDVQAMGAPARAMLRRVLKAHRARQSNVDTERTTAAAKLAEREAAIQTERRKLEQMRAQLAQTFGSSDYRDKLKAAAAVDPKTLDLLDPEGLKTYIAQQVAQGSLEMNSKLFEDAEKVQRQVRFTATVDKYDDWQDEAFRQRVNAALAAEKKAKRPIAGRLEEFILKQIAADRAAEREAERRKRRKSAQQSAKHTARRTASATTQATGVIPEHIAKKGGAALAEYFRKNPKQRAAWRAKQGR